MLEIGKTFVKNGNTFCLIELLDYEYERYAIFSVEDDKKQLSFVIYKVVENEQGYFFSKVEDEQTRYTLYKMIEEEGK